AADLSVDGVYPESRHYAGGLRSGSRLDVPLAPYETVVLSVQARPGAGAGTQARSPSPAHVKVESCEDQVHRVTFGSDRKALGPDWTSRLGEVTSAVRLKLRAEIDVAAPEAEFLVLAEGKTPPAAPVGRVMVNGREVRPDRAGSAAGWSATV